MSTHFLLVRHAESEWNALGRWQGHGDPPLSTKGVAQAVALAERLRGEACDALVSSDLMRARATAAALAKELGLPCEIAPDYRELDIGAWTGLIRGEIARIDAKGLERFEVGEADFRPGGGESRGQIRVRARRAVLRLCDRFPSARVVLVTHLGFIRALIPGAEPGNADVLRIDGPALLKLRRADEVLPEAPEQSL